MVLKPNTEMIKDYARRATLDIGSQFETTDSQKSRFEGIVAEFDCSGTTSYAVSAKERAKK